jgi:hypothetical protein
MARKRPPSEELRTEIYDSQQRARAIKPTKKGFESGEIAIPTKPDTVEIGTPTEIDPPRKERSEPIRVISMKTPAEIAAERKGKAEAKQHKAEIRSLSDVVGQRSTPPRGMGNFAPPANQKERNVRKLRDWLIWGSVLVIISCIVMLAVWFLAGRQ